MRSSEIREWQYRENGLISLNGGEKTIQVHPNMPAWIVAGNMIRRINRSDTTPDRVFVLSITDRCNIRCDYCCHPYLDSSFSDEDACRLVVEACALSFDEICVTGGEPYLQRRLLYELATICKSRGKLFGSITNGFWAKRRDEAFRLAAEMVEHGIARVTFSWDPTHGEYVSPQTIQNGIDACMFAGMRVCLSGSFKKKDDCHANYGIDVSAYTQYANFADVASYVSQAGWGKELQGLYHAPVSEAESTSYRCPGSDGQELVLYARDGLVQPCCSVHAGYDMPNLRVGDWRIQSVAELLDAQQGDSFFRVVVDGGFKLLYKIASERAPEIELPDPRTAVSACHLCSMVMTGPHATRLRAICDEYLTERLIEEITAHPHLLQAISASLGVPMVDTPM